jgi:hypothetical protein
MALIPVLVTFAPLTVIASADVNSNFSNIQTAFNNSAVLTDTAKTVTVTHIWTAVQTFTGGAAFGASITFSTDNAFDIGASGATRPRNIFPAGFLDAGGGMRTTGGGAYAAGSGAEVQFASGNANFLGFDRTGSVYLPTRVLGSTVALIIGGSANGLTVAATGQVTCTGIVLAQGALTSNGVITTSVAAGTGIFRAISSGGSGRSWDVRSNTTGSFSIVDVTGGQTRLTVDSTGTFLFTGALQWSPDATYDIGTAGAARPRSLFLSAGAVLGGSMSVGTTLDTGGLTTIGDVLWVTGATTTPASGLGVEIDGGSTPRILAFNRTGTAYLTLSIEASTINIRPSAVTVLSVAAGAVTVTGTHDVTSTLSAFRYKGRGTAPSVTVNATGTGSGTGATATLATGSSDTSGEVVITMGAGPVANGTLATFNFGTAMGGTNYFVLLTCYAGTGGAITFYIPNAGKAAGSWQISSTTAPTGTLVYRVEYAVFGTG